MNFIDCRIPCQRFARYPVACDRLSRGLQDDRDVQRDTTPKIFCAPRRSAEQAGLRYIYAGNLPGSVGQFEDTRCPQCGETLIRRYGYFIEDYRLTPEGRCPRLLMPDPRPLVRPDFDGQISSHPFLPHNRSPFVYNHQSLNHERAKRILCGNSRHRLFAPAEPGRLFFTKFPRAFLLMAVF